MVTDNRMVNVKPLPKSKPFGQHAPLTRTLRGLIRNYPKGVGILQEFIQNADDAGASYVKILLDKRVHGSSYLPAETMRMLQGPALVVFNDQVFSDADLESIQEVGLGNKTQNSSKTGRFGLGFNASYNVTDVPSFITRNGIYYFDPHRTTVIGATPENPGQSWEIDESTWSAYPDMLRPYTMFGFQEGQTHYPATVFRLPLRTPEQAAVSEISAEPFTEQDFHRVVEQLIPVSPEILLFLKHVTKVCVFEIGPEGNQEQAILECEIENVAEVNRNRGIINSVIFSDRYKMIKNLRDRRRTPPVVSYLQTICIRTKDYTERQTWRIVNGIYVDNDQAIIDIAEKIYDLDEKAVPWAGAAARLQVERESSEVESEPKPFTGRVFCFLPLQITSKLPVHINGFFDLDSSRQTLTTNHHSLLGKDAIRSQWNEALVEHCVAHAYADLITYLVDDIGKEDVKTFYKLWPDTRKELSGVLESLPKYVYEYLAHEKVLHSADEQEWRSVDDIYLIPDEWQEKLQAPLSNDGMPIPKPELPAFMKKGFEDAEVEFDYVTPAQVRSRLKINLDLAQSPAEIERLCLRRRNWLISLLKFCLSDKPGKDLVGVPLALLADGKVHTFGLFSSKWVFLASETERKIFAAFPHWFIDKDFAQECELDENSHVNLSRMTPGSVILNLNKIIKFEDQKNHVEWKQDSENPPNAQWLQLLFEYFTEYPPDIIKNENDFKKVPLIPDQFDRLWKVSLPATPLLYPDGLSKELNASLTKLGIPLVSGGPTLLKAIRGLIDALSKQYVWGVSARDLTDTLGEFAFVWQAKFANFEKAIHVPLLNYFSIDQTLQELRTLNDRVETLKKLLIVPTTEGSMVRANENGLFIPSNYEPPAGAGSLKLINSGKDGNWKSFFRLLGIQELDRTTLIQQILLPNYISLKQEDQFEVLEWIRDNLSIAETEQRKSHPNQPNIREIVSKAPLILCTDSQYRASSEIYDPRESKAITAVLGEYAFFPDMHFYFETDRWLKFFREDLGMAATPHAAALLGTIDKLTTEAQNDLEKISERLLDIFGFIVKTENWNRLINQKVTDSVSGSAPVNFFVALQKRKWLPAQRDSKRLERYVGYQIPEARLYQASELFMASSGHLVASQRPLAPFAQLDKSISQALQFPETPPLNVVIDHFDEILRLWHETDHSVIKEDQLNRSLGEIYRFFGRLSETHDIEFLRSYYSDTECLWDYRHNKFRLPGHVFEEQHRFMEPWRTSLKLTDDSQDKGYANLGRIKDPGVDDYVDFLYELHIEFNEDPIQDEAVIEKVLRVLRRLGGLLGEEEIDLAENDVPLLTRQKSLVLSSKVYVGDAPWFEERLTGEEIYLLNNGIGSEIIEAAKIPRLSECVIEALTQEPARSDNRRLLEYCANWQENICSKEFRIGLVRIIRHEYGYIRPGELDWLAKIHVTPVKSITTDLLLTSQGKPGKKIGSGTTSFYFDEQHSAFYLTAQKQRVMESYLAKAINSQLDEYRLRDTMPLASILSVPTDEIYETLTELRITSLPDSVLEDMAFEVDSDLERYEFETESEFSEEEAGEGDRSEPNLEDEEDTLPVNETSQPDGEEEAPEDGTDEYDDVDKVDNESHIPEVEDEVEEVEDDSQELPSSSTSQQTQSDGNEHGGTASPSTTSHTSHSHPGFSGFSGQGTGSPRDESVERQPTGRDVLPPTTPGTAKPSGPDSLLSDDEFEKTSGFRGLEAPFRPRRKRKLSGNERIFISGVFSRKHFTQGTVGDGDEETDPEAMRIGAKAVERVLAYEESCGRVAKPMHHNNPGYDVEVYTADKQKLLRYIEVKGINGAWGHGGVDLSSTQYRFGEEHADKFWLYVVEYVYDDDRFRVHPIENPTYQVTKYRFDYGWKQLANLESARPLEPEVGVLVHYKDGSKPDGRIVSIKGKDLFKQLKIKYVNGKEGFELFKPHVMELSRDKNE